METYKDFLSSRANLIDMEFHNDYSEKDELFLDGFHVVLEEKMRLVRVIFGQEDDIYARITIHEE